MKTDVAGPRRNAQGASIEVTNPWQWPERGDTHAPDARLHDLGSDVARHAVWLEQQGLAVIRLEVRAHRNQGVRHWKTTSEYV